MSQDQSFVDLRLNRQGGQTEESFWPSFTDIMTVVVMIFLLAMLVLLIRNMELMEQLRATMEAEREAATLARLTGEQKDTLTQRLHIATSQLSLLQKQLNHLEAQNEQQEAAIASQRHQLVVLEEDRNRSHGQQEQQQALLQTRRQELERLNREHRQLLSLQQQNLESLADQHKRHQAQSAQLTKAQRDLAETQSERDALLTRFTHERDALSALRNAHDDTSTELAASLHNARDLQSQLQTSRNKSSNLDLRLDQTQKKLQQARQRAGDAETRLVQVRAGHAGMLQEQEAAATALTAARRKAQELQLKLEIQEQALTQAMARLELADLSLSDMQEEYGNLKLKYEDLVKPARSATGRYLVEVRVTKEEGKLVTRFRESREVNFESLERPLLEQRLAELKAKHRNGLYIRVIIPEDSGLSYNEAWNFTTGIHGKYDYYYQNPRLTQ